MSEQRSTTVTRPPKVFVAQFPRPKADGRTPNLQPATQYGAIEFVFDASDRPHADMPSAIKKAQAVLSDFNPAKDYVLDIGAGCDPFAYKAVIRVLLDWWDDKIMHLCWSRGVKENGELDKENGYYFPVPV